jgi:uncharacterized damage-inducible protein DinB
MSETAIAAKFVEYSSARMLKSAGEIAKCVQQLSEEQMQQRGGEHENSVVNLLLHLEGNIRQWMLHGVAEQSDVRERDAEFALDAAASGEEALARLQSVVAEARSAIEAVGPERLMQVIDPQPTGIYRHPTVLEAIYKCVGHLEHHTGQIILLTKQMVGRDLDLSMPRKR